MAKQSKGCDGKAIGPVKWQPVANGSIADMGNAIFLRKIMIKGYKSIQEVSKDWNISPRQIQNLCANGKIPGAAKLGRSWAIPEDAEKPSDGRITTGEYRNWRKNSDRQDSSG